MVGIVVYLYVGLIGFGVLVQLLAALHTLRSTAGLRYFRYPHLAPPDDAPEASATSAGSLLPSSAAAPSSSADDDYLTANDNNNSINTTRCSVSVAKQRALRGGGSGSGGWGPKSKQQRREEEARRLMAIHNGGGGGGGDDIAAFRTLASTATMVSEADSEAARRSLFIAGGGGDDDDDDVPDFPRGAPSDLERPHVALLISAVAAVLLIGGNAAYVFAATGGSEGGGLLGGAGGEDDLACDPYFGRIVIFNESSDGDGNQPTTEASSATTSEDAPSNVSAAWSFVDATTATPSAVPQQQSYLHAASHMPVLSLASFMGPASANNHHTSLSSAASAGAFRTAFSAASALSASSASAVAAQSSPNCSSDVELAEASGDCATSTILFSFTTDDTQTDEHSDTQRGAVLSSNSGDDKKKKRKREIIGYLPKDGYDHFYSETAFCARSLPWLLHTVLLAVAALAPFALHRLVYAPFLAAGGFNNSDGPLTFAEQRAALYWSPLRQRLRRGYYWGLFGAALPILSEGVRLAMLTRFGTAQLSFSADGPALVGIIAFWAFLAAAAAMAVGWLSLLGLEWLFITRVFVIFRKIAVTVASAAAASATYAASGEKTVGAPTPLDSLSMDFELLAAVARREMRRPSVFIPHSILRTLWGRWRGPFLALSAVRLVQELLGLIPALLLRELVDGVVSKSDVDVLEGSSGVGALELNVRRGATVVAGLVGCAFASTMMRAHYDLKHSKIGLYCKAALSDAVYAHAAALRPHERIGRDSSGRPMGEAEKEAKEEKGKEEKSHFPTADDDADGADENEDGSTPNKATPSPTGSSSTIKDADIINHLLVDVPRVCDQIQHFNNIWCLPCQIGFALYLLYLQIGWGFLAGLVLTIAMVPTNAALCKKIGQINVAMMKANDARVGAVTEVIANIKFVKMCGWSGPIFDRVAVPRKAFMGCLSWVKYLDGVCAFFWATTPVLVSLASFITYAGIFNGVLTPGKVVASLALFNTLILPLNSYPWVLSGAVEAWVSLGRLQSFLYDYVPTEADDADAEAEINDEANPKGSDAKNGDAEDAFSAAGKGGGAEVSDAPNVDPLRVAACRAAFPPTAVAGRPAPLIILERIVVRRDVLRPEEMVRREAVVATAPHTAAGPLASTSSNTDAVASPTSGGSPSSPSSAIASPLPLTIVTEQSPPPPRRVRSIMPPPQSPLAAASGDAATPFECTVKRLVLRPGALTVIIGPAGGGKSTLLAGLAQEAAAYKYTRSILRRTNPDGSFCASGGSFISLPSLLPPHLSVAYLPQEAFVMDRSVRSNILFDREGEEEEEGREGGILEEGAIGEGRFTLATLAKETFSPATLAAAVVPPAPPKLSRKVALALLRGLAASAQPQLPAASAREGEETKEERPDVSPQQMAAAAQIVRNALLTPDIKGPTSANSNETSSGPAAVVTLGSLGSSARDEAPTAALPHPALRYAAILAATGLDRDITQWPMGDARRAGDGGDGLSGGQKHRVAFARALYADADVYVIDDFLGALDGQVAAHLVRTCVGSLLLRGAGKYVIIASEHPAVLKEAREGGGAVYRMENGSLRLDKALSSPEAVAASKPAVAGPPAPASVVPSSCRDLLPLFATPLPRGALANQQQQREGGAQNGAAATADGLSDGQTALLAKSLQQQLDKEESNADSVAADGEEEEEDGGDEGSPTVAQWLSTLSEFGIAVTAGSAEKNSGEIKAVVSTVANGTTNEAVVAVAPIPSDREGTDGEEAARIAREEEEAAREIKETGSISLAVFWAYIVAMGIPLFLFVVAFIVAMQGVRNYSDVFVAMWAADHEGADDDDAAASAAYKDDVNYFLKFLGVLAAVNVCLAMVRGLGFAFAGLKACATIHDDVVTRVIGSPFSFFSAVPRGRLINRLSHDVYCVDESLPFMFNIFLAQLVMFIGAVIVIGITSSFAVLGGAVPIVILLYFIQKPYRRANREVKRLEAAARSPIVDHLRTLLDGGTIMRCLGPRCVAFFNRRALRDYALWHRLSYNLSMLQWWFNLNMQLIGVGIVALVGIATIIVNKDGKAGSGGSGAASMGLALAYVAPLTGYISGLLGSFTELEKLFISVERIEEYRALETEAHLFEARQLVLRGRKKEKKKAMGSSADASASSSMGGAAADDSSDDERNGSTEGLRSKGFSSAKHHKGKGKGVITVTSPLLLNEDSRADEVEGVLNGDLPTHGEDLYRSSTTNASGSGSGSGSGGAVGRTHSLGAHDRGDDGRASIGSAHSLSSVVLGSGGGGGGWNKNTTVFGGAAGKINSGQLAAFGPDDEASGGGVFALMRDPLRPLSALPRSNKAYRRFLALMDAHWPFAGHSAIAFSNVSVRYTQGGPLVLRNITRLIAAGERVALVGRTGSGKSSLVMALLGLVETTHVSVGAADREASFADAQSLSEGAGASLSGSQQTAIVSIGPHGTAGGNEGEEAPYNPPSVHHRHSHLPSASATTPSAPSASASAAVIGSNDDLDPLNYSGTDVIRREGVVEFSRDSSSSSTGPSLPYSPAESATSASPSSQQQSFISIAGIDTRIIDPEWVRSHITVLPQECLVLEGSLYSNLDSFGRCGGGGEDFVDGDDERRRTAADGGKRANALPLSEQYRRAVMRTVLHVLGLGRFGLAHAVTSGGKNLSAGERTLVSIARVVVDSFAMVEDGVTEEEMRAVMVHPAASADGAQPFPSANSQPPLPRQSNGTTNNSCSLAKSKSRPTSPTAPIPLPALPFTSVALERAPRKAKARIVVMDEPAASLDGRSEALLWALVARCFAESTVLAITHKLEAIVSGGFFSRVLVMSSGRIVADNTPKTLAARGVGPFASLLAEEAKGAKEAGADTTVPTIVN